MTALFKLLASLPLALLQSGGAFLGWLTYLLSPTFRQRMKENLAIAGLTDPKILHEAIAQQGRMVGETPHIWLRTDPDRVRALCVEVLGWEHVESLQAQGKGLIFLTPHLGCFEITAQYIATKMPITAMYRPPRKDWLKPIVAASRARPNMTMATADLKGVRTLAKALKRGEAVGIVCDQAPSSGEGVWAPFFGKSAYTITLPSKLYELAGNGAIVPIYAERLAHGQGYRLQVVPFTAHEITPTTINLAMEDLIRRCPGQYLWSYNRYKVPPGSLNQV